MGWLFRPARAAGPLTRSLLRLADPRLFVKLVLGVAVAGLVVVPLAADLVNAATKTASSTQGDCRIVRVIDGDTVSLLCPEDGIENARLLGFDTPEKYAPRCLGEFMAAERASWHLRALIQRADQLTLTRDGRDRYGRALVRLELDGVDVARTMVRDGYGRAYGGGLRGTWC
ncbi:thermonuclease family protein [Tabrizicola sp.]|jgi:micrococcal nuclease|uniref:thermonuclease family protein n=1 Tax=Tabrizicola sp. TaxID=2005166 RepID=UPI002600F9DB|nr:thermonuclease family protein [Tabrizicola sp.]MBY0351844.1 thermonuclease family protein [Tabrizicola sp.]